MSQGKLYPETELSNSESYSDNDTEAQLLAGGVRNPPRTKGTSSVPISKVFFAVGSAVPTFTRRPFNLRYAILGLVTVALLTVFGRPGKSNTTNGLSALRPLQSSLEVDHLHPTQRLVAAGQAKVDTLIQRQSRAVEEATTEYRRRYGRRPPRGFGKWFALAQAQGLVLIDEFDTLMSSLEPFWGVEPATLCARMDGLAATPNVARVILDGTGYSTSWTEEHWALSTIEDWVKEIPWRDFFTEVEVLLDIMDEPRISAPYDTLHDALDNAATQISSIDGPSPELMPGGQEVYWYSFPKCDTWQFLQDACHNRDPARNGPRPSVIAPDFVTDVRARADPCMNPSLHKEHNIWLSPPNLLLTKQLVPIMSQARPVRFNDILYPSPFYARMQEEGMEDTTARTKVLNVPWEKKHDRVYWAGTSNGRFSTMESWRHLQRQRMAMLTEASNTKPVALLMRNDSARTSPNDPAPWVRRPGTVWADLQAYFHIKIALVEPCDEDACKDQNDYFHPVLEPRDESLTSKYVTTTMTTACSTTTEVPTTTSKAAEATSTKTSTTTKMDATVLRAATTTFGFAKRDHHVRRGAFRG